MEIDCEGEYATSWAVSLDAVSFNLPCLSVFAFSQNFSKFADITEEKLEELKQFQKKQLEKEIEDIRARRETSELSRMTHCM